MEIPNIYVHDGKIIRVIEEPEQARLTMVVSLPILEHDEQLESRLLIFEDVYGYHVVEGCINGCPTLLNFNVIGQEERWSRVRLDTNVGYREILCRSVRVIQHQNVA
jgi:hypothetical protein